MPRPYRYRFHRRQTQRTGLAVVCMILLSLPLASFTQPQTFLNPMGADTIEVHRVEAQEPIQEPKIIPSNDIEAYILEVFGDDAPMAIAIAWGESGMQPQNIGDNNITYMQDGVKYGMSCGLFQIRVLPGRPTCEQLLDPHFNIDYAKKIFDRSGWKPWTVYKTGKYLEFM